MVPRVELSDGVIVLKPHGPAYVDQVYEAVMESGKELAPWMVWYTDNYTMAESATWVMTRPDEWDRGISFDFAVIEKSSGEFLGNCGLNDVHPREGFANLGYWIRTSQTGKGVAVSAARLVAEFGFSRVKLNRIEIVIADKNMPSQKVAQKLGAKKEGLLRNRIPVHNIIHDAYMFSLVPGDIITT